MAAAAERQASSDEVIQPAGLRPWQLVLWPVPVLTRAVVQWAWCYSPLSTPALALCCFSLAWYWPRVPCGLPGPQREPSCCRALEPFHSVSLLISFCGHTHCATAVLTGNKGSGYVANTLVNSIMQSFNALMCSDNGRIIEGTDAISPQQSFVATCLSHGRWKMDKMNCWGSEEGPYIPR